MKLPLCNPVYSIYFIKNYYGDINICIKSLKSAVYFTLNGSIRSSQLNMLSSHCGQQLLYWAWLQMLSLIVRKGKIKENPSQSSEQGWTEVLPQSLPRGKWYPTRWGFFIQLYHITFAGETMRRKSQVKAHCVGLSCLCPSLESKVKMVWEMGGCFGSLQRQKLVQQKLCMYMIQTSFQLVSKLLIVDSG